MTIRIDVISVPFAGHLYPILTLVKPLLDDPTIKLRIFTGKSRQEQLQALGFEAYSLFPDQERVLENISEELDQPGIGQTIQRYRSFLSLVPSAVEQIESVWQKEGQAHLIIGDFISLPAAILAQKHDIPWITTNSSPVSIEGYKDTPSYMGGLFPGSGLLARVRNVLLWKLTKWTKKAVYQLVRSSLGPYKDLPLYRADGTESIYSDQSILALGLKEMEFRKDYPSVVKWAGYRCLSFDKLPEHFLSYFETKRRKVFVTSGNHLLYQKKVMVESTVALAKEHPDLDFYVSLGQREGLGREADQVLENCWVFDYLPYNEVVKHMDYAIHHGGIGIMYECLDYQIPSLVLPQAHDQADYAARLDYYGAGIYSKKEDLSYLKDQFKKLVEQKDWPALGKLSQISRSQDSLLLLYEEIHRLVK